MEQYWNVNDMGKPNYWEETLSQCESVHHTSQQGRGMTRDRTQRTTLTAESRQDVTKQFVNADRNSSAFVNTQLTKVAQSVSKLCKNSRWLIRSPARCQISGNNTLYHPLRKMQCFLIVAEPCPSIQSGICDDTIREALRSA